MFQLVGLGIDLHVGSICSTRNNSGVMPCPTYYAGAVTGLWCRVSFSAAEFQQATGGVSEAEGRYPTAVLFVYRSNWETGAPTRQLRGGFVMKMLSIPLTIILLTLLVGLTMWVSNIIGGSLLLEWTGIIIAVVATYKFGRWFVN